MYIIMHVLFCSVNPSLLYRSETDLTPLHRVCVPGSVPIAELLLKHGAKIDPPQPRTQFKVCSSYYFDWCHSVCIIICVYIISEDTIPFGLLLCPTTTSSLPVRQRSLRHT